MILFKTRHEMVDFLSRFGEVSNRLEYHVFEKYDKNRLLVTAEHAFRRAVNVRNTTVGVGEINVGWLARLAAYHTKSAYTIPRVHRIDADPARPPEMLGKGVYYRARGIRGNKSTRIKIHKREDYKKYLENYHGFIRRKRPRSLLSVHGVGPHHIKKHDAILGFGRHGEFIGKNPSEFRNELSERIEHALKKIDLEKYPNIGGELNIAIGRQRYTGSTNYILRTFVAEPNKKEKGSVKGVQVELSRRGRNIDGGISVEFQALIQSIADMLTE